MDPAMQKVSEYESHAAECRQMAAKMRDPVQKEQLEEMAEAWTMLAGERRKHLLKQATGRQFDPPSSAGDGNIRAE